MSAGHERLLQPRVALPSSQPHPDPTLKRNVSIIRAKAARGSSLLEIRPMVPPACARPQQNSTGLTLARENLRCKPVLNSLLVLSPGEERVSERRAAGTAIAALEALGASPNLSKDQPCRQWGQKGSHRLFICQMKETESLIVQEGCANLGGCVLPTETSELKNHNAEEHHLSHG